MVLAAARRAARTLFRRALGHRGCWNALAFDRGLQRRYPCRDLGGYARHGRGGCGVAQTASIRSSAAWRAIDTLSPIERAVVVELGEDVQCRSIIFVLSFCLIHDRKHRQPGKHGTDAYHRRRVIGGLQ